MKHDIGTADVDISSARANPPREYTDALARNQRARKLELAALRADLAGRARATVASGPEHAAPYLDRLRAVDREVAATEDGLDRLYDLLRPGAERQGARRTRAAALDLARARLNVLDDAIATVPDASKRLKLLNPQFTPDSTTTTGQITVAIIRRK
jgi:hypothetical protein